MRVSVSLCVVRARARLLVLRMNVCAQNTNTRSMGHDRRCKCVLEGEGAQR